MEGTGIKDNPQVILRVCPVMERQELGRVQTDCGIPLMGNALSA